MFYINAILIPNISYCYHCSSVGGGHHTLKAIGKQVYSRIYENLVDFDNHLDSVELDWTNPDINRSLADIETAANKE